MPRKQPKRENIMLAYPVDPGKLNRLGERFYIQPKLRGERCRVEWFRDEPVLISSYNNIWPHLEHIHRQLKEIYRATGTQLQYDGELYKHGWSQERINSASKCPVNYNPENAQLELHVFDIRDESFSQEQRIVNAIVTLSNQDFDSPVKMVKTYLIESHQWADASNEFLDEGYEGSVMRKANGKYEDKRSTSLLKFKPTEEDIYYIIGMNEAISLEGEPKGMVGSFVVQDNDGNSFAVGAGKLVHSKRIEYWIHKEGIIGCYLLTKHEKLRTTNDVPVSAVAVDIKRRPYG